MLELQPRAATLLPAFIGPTPFLQNCFAHVSLY
jgi:hypothetical protein